MTKTDDGGAAFPVAEIGTHGTYGMTYRQWLAGQAMAGMVAFSGTVGWAYGPGEIAKRSLEVADALIAAEKDTSHD